VAQVDPGAGGGIDAAAHACAVSRGSLRRGVAGRLDRAPEAVAAAARAAAAMGACWLALQLWQELRLDRFWGGRPTAGRKGTRWDEVLFVLWPTG
jgi:hypothetical protein